jgi:4'-phosphopantetheinyl transferase
VEPPCGLRFSLSNTAALVVCAVWERGDVGVDIEPLDRGADVLEVADTVFAPQELAALRSLEEPAARRDRALDLWTLKESYIKARGVGLSLPLERLSFHLEGLAPVRIAIHPSLGDRPERWQFRRFDVEGHRLALAVERDSLAELAVSVRDATADLAR